MLVSDRDLPRLLASGELKVDPLDPELIQPSSIDVRLSNRFVDFTLAETVIDPARHQPRLTAEHVLADGDVLDLEPGEFVLASTMEVIGLADHLAARLEGKSSLGRLGLAVHATAGFIDPGFLGAVTLELANLNRLPIRLYPGMPIGQLCVFRMTSPAVRPYGAAGLGSHYQGQRGPTPSRTWRGWRTWPQPDAA